MNLLRIQGIASLVFALSMTLPSRSQVTTGQIFGTVTESSGAVIVGANIVATNLSKGITVTATTNSSGDYTVRNLVPDNYSVEVSAPGFRTTVRPMVIVVASNGAQVNTSLQVGEVTEKVEVSEAPPLLKVDSAEVQTTLSEEELANLPVVNRNFTAFMLEVPGTIYTGWAHANAENPQRSSQVQVNGQNFWGTNYQLDGTDNEDRVLGIAVINPSLDSVQEATVLTHNFDAQYGNATGAIMAAQTKSGTDTFHGVAFDYLQNDKLLQARDQFSEIVPDPITHRLKPPLRYNQFGGNLGGRIVKDKLFFFGDYQGTRRRRSSEVVTFVPTVAERQGDFSAYPYPIFDPATGNADGTGRTQFSYNGSLNVIPPARLNPVSQNILNALPPQNFNGFNLANQNFLGFGKEVFNSDSYTTREDWFINNRMTVFGRYSLSQYSLEGPNAFGSKLGGPSLNGVGLGGVSSSRNQSLAVGFNYGVSSTLLTDFRLGFFRYRVAVDAHDNGQDLATTFGIPGINLGGPFTSGFPAMDIQGGGGLIGDTQLGGSLGDAQCNCPLRENEWQIQFVNNWTKVAGKHDVKWGADVRHLHDFRFSSAGIAKGSYSFSNTTTSSLNTPQSGLGLAGFLLGAVSNFGRLATPFEDSTSSAPATLLDTPFFYVQDKWRVTHTLSLTAGLRWDLYLPQHVNHAGRGGWFDFNTGNAIVAGYGPYGLDGGVKATYRTFAPRLGIVWQGTPQTVVRAGYGRSFTSGNFGFLFGNAASINYPVWVNQAINPTNVYEPVFALNTAPPSALDLVPKVSSYQQTGEVPLPGTVTMYAYPRKQIVPTLDSWSLSVETQLAPNTSFTLSYVGNKGTNIDVGGGNLNVSPVIPPINDPLGSLYQAPYYVKNGNTAPVYSENSGQSSNYNALQVVFQQRPLKGLDAQANYTWGKAMGYNGSWVYGLKYGYGPVGFDVTNNLNVLSTYELPFGSNRAFLTGHGRLLNSLIGDWSVNAIWNWHTGRATNAYYNGSGCLNCPFTAYPDKVGDPYAGAGKKGHFWNLAAFQDVPPSTQTGVQRQGHNASFDDLRGPHFWVANMSVFKAFKLAESVHLQVRLESYNVFNHVNWGVPSSYIDGAGFGQVTSTQQFQQDQSAMRSGQAGLKLTF